LKDIYQIVHEWKKRPGQNHIFATLVRAEGSSYRRPGARMLICEDGTTAGSLSAGCIENEVASRAREVLQTGRPAMMTFDTRRRFGCAGKIHIFIERVEESFFADLAADLEARNPHVMVTRFGDQEFVQKIHPPIRLVTVGDGLDSRPIRSLANLLGWQVMDILDPNVLSIERDDWTAAIVKSHNYGRDFVALQKLLPLNLPYVGLIGPRKRRDQLMNALLDLDVTINGGFFAPAGMDLGAETPEEIALSIVSEIQRVFGKGSGDSLRERKLSIHQMARDSSRCEKLPQ
jgi:xanthine/CO dehydrogenase XdhC/CoxF family maturation factor